VIAAFFEKERYVYKKTPLVKRGNYFTAWLQWLFIKLPALDFPELIGFGSTVFWYWTLQPGSDRFFGLGFYYFCRYKDGTITSHIQRKS